MERKKKMEKLFVYGTLREPAIQRRAFGRIVLGELSILAGYKKEYKYIRGEQYPIIEPNENSKVKGLLLLLTPRELARADDWEDKIYKREKVTPTDGELAWAYVYTKTNKRKVVVSSSPL